MPIEPFESYSEKMIVEEVEEEEEEVAVDMEGVETVLVEVNRRHHVMAEEEEEAAVVDVVTMTDPAVAGPGMVGKANTRRNMVAGVEVEVAMVVGIRTVVTTNKSEATMEAGNGLHRGNRVHRTMKIEQCTIIAKFLISLFRQQLEDFIELFIHHFHLPL